MFTKLLEVVAYGESCFVIYKLCRMYKSPVHLLYRLQAVTPKLVNAIGPKVFVL